MIGRRIPRTLISVPLVTYRTPVLQEDQKEDLTLLTCSHAIADCLPDEPVDATHLKRILSVFIRARAEEGVQEADALAEAMDVTAQLREAKRSLEKAASPP